MNTLILGQKVYCTKTGVNHVGKLVGLVTVGYYLKYCAGNTKVQQFTTWNELFPDWQYKLLAYIELDIPQKSCSYKEFCVAYPTIANEEVLMEMYDKMVGFVTITACPIDGVETVEEN